MNDPAPDIPMVRIYRRTLVTSGAGDELPDGLIAKFRVYLPDRPGSLAAFAAAIAGAGGNIVLFHYDRSVDSSRVAVEVQVASRDRVDILLASLAEGRFGLERAANAPDDVEVTSEANVLELKARLENRPGTLAAFARLLAEHGANVIYMLYDEDIDPGSADIAMAVRDPAEIDRLLAAVNEQGYAYRVVYRGGDEQAASNVIGLKLVEKFFLRLRRLLPASGIEELRSLVDSSKELEQDLVRFYAEAGNNLEAGEVFEKVLALASRSRSWTGERFRCRPMEPLMLPGGVELHGFRLPTSENVYLFRHGGAMTMIDAGHGVYFRDFTAYLRGRSWDPAGITRIFLTHPDTDHAGMSGYFEREFGTEVFMHPASDDVIANQNRAWGASGGLLNLNRYYTRLSSRFTDCRFPERPRRFPTAETGRTGGFSVIDRFSVGPLAFEVLESRGGHTPGLVFYLERAQGLLFTSDFLINVASLQPDEKEHLGIYRYLLTNPNRDRRLYREETEAMKELTLAVDDDLRSRGGSATVLPGHGVHYPAEELRS